MAVCLGRLHRCILGGIGWRTGCPGMFELALLPAGAQELFKVNKESAHKKALSAEETPYYSESHDLHPPFSRVINLLSRLAPTATISTCLALP